MGKIMSKRKRERRRRAKAEVSKWLKPHTERQRLWKKLGLELKRRGADDTERLD